MIHDQKIRLDRIYTQPLYLIEQQSENDSFVFQISGSTANLYTVKINSEIPEINELICCNCPDSSSWAFHAGVKCKHCCFVWIKVLGLDPELLDSYIFAKNADTNSKLVKEKCLNLAIRKELINETYQKRYQELKKHLDSGEKLPDKFSVTKDVEEEDCPICFDKLSEKDSSQCPTCRNVVHTKCIRKWLSLGNKSCVYCRGDWGGFFKDRTKTGNTKYVNLINQ